MATPDQAVALPLGTHVRINSKGKFKTFFEGYEGDVVYVEPLHHPEDGFACYVALEDGIHIARSRYFFTSRDLDIVTPPVEREGEVTV